MEESRDLNIQLFSGDGNLLELKSLLESGYTQLEIDIALENAIAYSQIETAEYLLTLGAEISNFNYQGVYYAVHNNELEGLKYAISKGIDINLMNGMILNTSIETAINTNDAEIVKWILENKADPSLLTKDSWDLIRSYGTAELRGIINNATQQHL
jgi:ankyrin repeat protein